MATTPSRTAERNLVPGRWLDSGRRNALRGSLTWGGIAGRGYSAMIDGQLVATVRKRGLSKGGWMARIPGWTWTVTPKMPSARFHLKEVEVRAFPSAAAGQRAVEAAFALLASLPREPRAA